MTFVSLEIAVYGSADDSLVAGIGMAVGSGSVLETGRVVNGLVA